MVDTHRFKTGEIMVYDVVIKNGTIVDGTGRERFKGDIGISRGKISFIGDLGGETGEITLNAEGLIVSPGFIDVHTHADTILLHYPEALNYVYQGVTTVIGGNCGYSPRPLREMWLMDDWEYDWWHEISPYKWYRLVMLSLEKVNEKMREKYGWIIDWKTIGEFLDRLEERGVSINYVPMAGHNTIRAAVMGLDYKREASKSELREMKELLEESLDEGAIGFSTGLDYEPGRYATTGEIVELVETLRDHGGIYVSHVRSRVKGFLGEKYYGVVEAIEIGRRTGVPVHISHLFSVYDVYPPLINDYMHRCAARQTIKIIDDALGKGINVTYDIIPNTSGGLFVIPYLKSLLSPWIIEMGSIERVLRALKIPEVKEEILRDIRGGKNPYWMHTIVVIEHAVEDYVGKSISEVSKIMGLNEYETVFRLLELDTETRIKRDYVSEGEVEEFLEDPRCMIGSDTFALDVKWKVNYPPYFLPHMNTYGAFTRLIRRYVYEKRVLALEEAIRKVTPYPAERFKLENRGVLKVGAWADIVVFDENKIKDNGDFIEPRRYSSGIVHVVVNGVPVVVNGEYTGEKCGMALRKGRGVKCS